MFEQFQNMFIDAVRANGNYGEIWKKSMVLSRVGLNAVNDGSTGLLLSSPFGNVKNQGPPPREGGTIDRILTRGYLKVGLEMTNTSFVSFFNDIGEGISAALFKGQVKVEVVSVSSLNRFTALAGGAVDIVVGPTRNLAREMKEPVTGEAFDFTEPVYYNGMTFSGPMPYGGCADDLQFSDNDCRNTIICVAEGTTWLEVMRNRLIIPEENILATLDWAESISKLFSGECNAIAHETYEFENIPEDMHPFHNGTKKHTKEPLAVMSRADDSQFSDLLRWIVYGIIYAEEEGITAETSDQMPLTNLFGGDLTGIWQDSIKAVGNYGNIYERNLGGYLPRTSPNTLNDRSSPQLYANPGTV